MPDDLQPADAEDRGGVFISHVHEDQRVAEAFALLIQDITAGSVATYSSSSTTGDGIKYGTEWFQWIKASVAAADHVVAILTPNSIERPWILFEAGLGKAHDPGVVFGLAVGISVADASVGPFGVFQNSGSDRASLIKLCRQLIEPSGLKPRNEVIGTMVDTFLKSIESVSMTPKESPEDSRTAAIFQAIEDLKFVLRERSERSEPRPAHRGDRELFSLFTIIQTADTALSERMTMTADCSEVAGLPAVAIVLRAVATRLGSRRGAHGLTFAADELVRATRPRNSTAEMCLNLARQQLEEAMYTSLPKHVREAQHASEIPPGVQDAERASPARPQDPPPPQS